MKRTYNKPVLNSETFVPNNYVAACFTYRANLVCNLGQWHKNNNCERLPQNQRGCYESNGAHHGAPCAESTVTVTVRDGKTTLSGTEGANKTHITLESVNIPGVNEVDHVGQTFTDCNWVSTDGGKYNHTGNGEVTYFSRQANAS